MKFSRLLFLLTFGVFASCNFNSEQNEEVDEIEVEDQVTVEHEINNLNLMEDWDKSWNEENELGFTGLIADDAVLLTGGEGVTGADNIISWLTDNSAVMKGLTREAMVNSSGEEIRYQAGSFSIDDNADENVQRRGTYTMIWEQEDDEQWKIKVIDISSEEDLN